MTADEFKIFWNANYPETLPISHYFKHDYAHRWFRIHSLPLSKRYATNDEEWAILLNRQNQIITDLIGENAHFMLVTGEYWTEGYTELHPLSAVDSIKQIPFIVLETIDFYQLSNHEDDNDSFYQPMFSEQLWTPGKFDPLLRDIADDNLRALFISGTEKLIIAPYDGGIDLILPNTETRDMYKRKYGSWLSDRQDGL